MPWRWVMIQALPIFLTLGGERVWATDPTCSFCWGPPRFFTASRRFWCVYTFCGTFDMLRALDECVLSVFALIVEDGLLHGMYRRRRKNNFPRLIFGHNSARWSLRGPRAGEHKPRSIPEFPKLTTTPLEKASLFWFVGNVFGRLGRYFRAMCWEVLGTHVGGFLIDVERIWYWFKEGFRGLTTCQKPIWKAPIQTCQTH